MIFQNIDFHNVEEMIPSEYGYRMARIPSPVRETLNERARENAAFSATGIELRFKIRSGEADLYLYAEADPIVPAFLYYGYFQGGWPTHAYAIRPGENRIHLANSPVLERLQEVTKKENLPFSPEVIRLVLPSSALRFVRLEGDIVPPEEQDVPAHTLLSYGSSITHGSLSLGPGHNYVFQLARKLSCDSLNLGLAGSAHLEKSLAEYIISRKDWHFATFELGINMVDQFSPEEFERRVSDFLSVLKRDTRPMFITDIFSVLGSKKCLQTFREIVRRHMESPFIFTPGEALLDELPLISTDMVHPSLEGQAIIARRWGETIARHLQKEIRY